MTLFATTIASAQESLYQLKQRRRLNFIDEKIFVIIIAVAERKSLSFGKFAGFIYLPYGDAIPHGKL